MIERYDASQAIAIISKEDRQELRAPRWSDEVIESAFQAWAFLDNQDVRAVKTRLQSGDYCLDNEGEPIAHDVPLRTLQDWVIRHDWHDQHERFLQQSAGGIVKRVVGNMLQVALNGSHSISTSVNEGRPPSKELIEAVKLATSVIGLSAIGSRDPSKGVLSGGSANRRARQLHRLTDAELLEAERELAEPDDD